MNGHEILIEIFILRKKRDRKIDMRGMKLAIEYSREPCNTFLLSCLPLLVWFMSGCNDITFMTSLMCGWKPDSDSDVDVRVKADEPEYVCRKTYRVWEIVPKGTGLVRKQPLAFICLAINHPWISLHTHTYTETSAAISCVQPLFHPLSTPFSPIYEEALMDRQTVDTARYWSLWAQPVMMDV